MIRAILLSIQSKPVMNIFNDLKTLELRSVLPKELKEKIEQGSGMWAYIYCTKGKPYIVRESLYLSGKMTYILRENAKYNILNGLVLGRFWLDEYDVITYDCETYESGYRSCGYNVSNETLKKLCLSYEELSNYGNGWDEEMAKDILYALHIKKLEIFAEPMELSEFYKDLHYPQGITISPSICDFDGSGMYFTSNTYEECLEEFKVKKAPQSFMYVYVKEEL